MRFFTLFRMTHTLSFPGKRSDEESQEILHFVQNDMSLYTREPFPQRRAKKAPFKKAETYRELRTWEKISSQKCRKLFSSRPSAFLVKQSYIYRITEDGGEIFDEGTSLCQALPLAQQFLLHFFKKVEEKLGQSLRVCYTQTHLPLHKGGFVSALASVGAEQLPPAICTPQGEGFEILRYAQNDTHSVIPR